MSDHSRTRRLDALNHDFIRRGIRISAWLPWWERLAAWSGGHRDGRFDVLGTTDPGRVLTAPGCADPGFDTFWLGRSRSAFEQADRRAFLDIEARVAMPTYELVRLVREHQNLVTRKQQVVDRIAALSSRVKPHADSVVPGPAEATASIAVVVARRMSAWNAPLASATAELAGIEAHLTRIAESAANLYGVVTVAFEAAVTRSNAIRAHYERRCDVYRRALTHASPNGPLVQAAGAGTLAIPAPAWTTAECPWVPAAYFAITKENSDVH